MLTQHLLAKQIPPELTFKPNLSLTAPQDGASTFFKTPLTEWKMLLEAVRLCRASPRGVTSLVEFEAL